MNIFSIEYSEEEISLKLDVNHKDWMTFNDNFDNVLKEHVPKKIKPHVSNTLRSTLWSVPIWKKKSIKLHYPAINKITKKKQRTLVPKSSKQLKKNYFENIEDKKCTYLLNKHNDGNSKLRRRKSFMKGLKLQMPFIHTLNQ